MTDDIHAILQSPSATFTVRPPTYPLSLTSDGVAYWQLNAFLIAAIDGWRAWQSKRSMAEIIPRIDALRDGVA